MPLYYAERRPRFLPLFAVGRLYPGKEVVLEKGKKGTSTVTAKALDNDSVEIRLNQPEF